MLFNNKHKNIDIEYTTLMNELMRISSVKDLTIARGKLQKFTLKVKKLNSPPYAVIYTEKLETMWNHRYKFIQLKFRG
jgi:hypothetical protein